MCILVSEDATNDARGPEDGREECIQEVPWHIRHEEGIADRAQDEQECGTTTDVHRHAKPGSHVEVHVISRKVQGVDVIQKDPFSQYGKIDICNRRQTNAL